MSYPTLLRPEQCWIRKALAVDYNYNPEIMAMELPCEMPKEHCSTTATWLVGPGFVSLKPKYLCKEHMDEACRHRRVTVIGESLSDLSERAVDAVL